VSLTTGTDDAKERGEGAAFAGAILGMVHHCDKDAATLIYKNMKIDSATPMGDGYAAIKAAFEGVYSCLGITCADVGGLKLNDNSYYEGAAPCVPDGIASTGQSLNAYFSVIFATAMMILQAVRM